MLKVADGCISKGDNEVLTCAKCGAPIHINKPMEMCICTICGVVCYKCNSPELNARLIKIVAARNWRKESAPITH